MVERLLNDNGSLSRDEIEGLAKHKLKHEENKNLSGFAMRFEEALQDSMFVEVSPGSYRLVKNENESHVPS